MPFSRQMSAKKLQRFVDFPHHAPLSRYPVLTSRARQDEEASRPQQEGQRLRLPILSPLPPFFSLLRIVFRQAASMLFDLSLGLLPCCQVSHLHQTGITESCRAQNKRSSLVTTYARLCPTWATHTVASRASLPLNALPRRHRLRLLRRLPQAIVHARRRWHLLRLAWDL